MLILAGEALPGASPARSDSGPACFRILSARMIITVLLAENRGSAANRSSNRWAVAADEAGF
ncbi:hypothetical protein Asn12ST33_08170 [Cutibacterium acnes]|nr:hypothetical protein Asn12ST33_08170 [Cutibacterium acnes]